VHEHIVCRVILLVLWQINQRIPIARMKSWQCDLETLMETRVIVGSNMRLQNCITTD